MNGCCRRHAACCYSFPWCTWKEIRKKQPIRLLAWADESRYRAGSGRRMLAARCNSRSSSRAKSAPNMCRLRAHTARCRSLYVKFRVRGEYFGGVHSRACRRTEKWRVLQLARTRQQHRMRDGSTVNATLCTCRFFCTVNPALSHHSPPTHAV